MENIPITPLADRVLIKPIEAEESTYGNIVVPDMGKDRPDFGNVLSVGPGRYDNNGNLIPMRVKVGQKVIMPKYGANTVEIEGEEYILAAETEILGTIN
jgi:chaperonin GroES|tara:strand:+ start:195 stop:491 length:297 start_codon:yes stop_codon:yes gene_type:complete